MRRITTALAALTMAAGLAPLASSAAPCHPAPEEACRTAPPLYQVGVDINVLVTSQGFITPDEGVKMGKRVAFQNLDNVPRRATSPGCLDGGVSGACVFNLELPVGARGAAAKSLFIHPANGFNRGITYSYVDPATMQGGLFTVH